MSIYIGTRLLTQHEVFHLFNLYNIYIYYSVKTLSFFFQEYEIDKKLGIKGPDDVAKIGIEKYNAECRKIIMRYSADWEVCHLS